MIEHDVTDEAHRADCAECAATWAELEAISAEARALPRLTPSRDLWEGIEARIARGKPQRRRYTQPAVRYAAAAALLMTTTAAVTWRIATDRAATTGAPALPTVATATSGDDGTAPALDGTPDPAVRTVAHEQDFAAMDLEIGALRTLLEERRMQLEPQTLEVLERNLGLIDQAIAESRAALAKDPASQFLATRLARAYTTKLTLLRSTATMPVGT